MGKVYEALTPALTEWIGEQKLFFVATAPLAAGGLVNCSPKGMDTFRILGPREVAYLDLTGSGVETIAHLRENGRIVLMFCALNGPPKIVRLYGTGDVVTPETADYARLRPLFPDHPGARAIIRVHLTRIGDSCGYGVPLFDFAGERDTLRRVTQAKGPMEIEQYRRAKNVRSIEGLPGLDPAE